jgi:hypothetical protein
LSRQAQQWLVEPSRRSSLWRAIELFSFAFFLDAGDFVLEVLIHHNQHFNPKVDTRTSATLLLDVLGDKFGKVADGEGNAIHLPLVFPPHNLTEGPVNIYDGRRGRIAQQHINIHP